MRKVVMLMFTTIDGVAEFPLYGGQELGDEEDPMWTERMKSIDTIFLGATTYRKWASYWPLRKTDPDATQWQRDYSRFADSALKVVFSKSLPAATWENTVIARGDPSEEVARLKALPGKDMALAGGPRLAQSFLERELVDEMLLEVFPSTVGRGKPLFRVEPHPDNPEDAVPAGARGRHDFRLLEAKGLKGGSVFLRYARAG